MSSGSMRMKKARTIMPDLCQWRPCTSESAKHVGLRQNANACNARNVGHKYVSGVASHEAAAEDDVAE